MTREMPPRVPVVHRTAGKELSWHDLRRQLARDRKRIRDVAGGGDSWLQPSYRAVALYRLSNYFHRRNCRNLARLFWQLNLLLTGADIAPITEAGAGLVIVHTMSTTLCGTLGQDCTVWGYGGIGGGRSAIDIGAGPGLPVLGNNVELGLRSLVLGPIRIGDRCRIGPGCVVLHDIPADIELAVCETAQVMSASSHQPLPSV